jgi:hypothetical protein
MPAAILPPLIIITGAFAVIGGGIYACQKGFDGRIKHVGADEFDRMMVPPSTTDATTFYVYDSIGHNCKRSSGNTTRQMPHMYLILGPPPAQCSAWAGLVRACRRLGPEQTISRVTGQACANGVL